MEVRAPCTPVEGYFENCPNGTNLKLEYGHGVTSDLLFLALQMIPSLNLTLINLEQMIDVVHRDDTNPFIQILLENKVDLLPLEWVAYSPERAEKVDFLLEPVIPHLPGAVVVNPRNQSDNVTLFHAFNTSVWMYGILTYLTLALTFVCFGRKKASLHLLLDISFNQRKRELWSTDSIYMRTNWMFLLITLWSFFSRIGLMLFKIQIVKVMTPIVVPRVPFQSMVEVTNLMQQGLYTYSTVKGLWSHKIIHANTTWGPKFKSAMDRHPMKVHNSTEQIMLHHISATPGDFTIEDFETAGLIQRRYCHLQVIGMDELDPVYYPFTGFPKHFLNEQHKQRIQTLTQTMKSFQSRFFENGLRIPLEGKYDINSRLETVNIRPCGEKKWRPISVSQLIVPLQTLGIGVAISTLSWLFENLSNFD